MLVKVFCVHLLFQGSISVILDAFEGATFCIVWCVDILVRSIRSLPILLQHFVMDSASAQYLLVYGKCISSEFEMVRFVTVDSFPKDVTDNYELVE